MKRIVLKLNMLFLSLIATGYNLFASTTNASAEGLEDLVSPVTKIFKFLKAPWIGILGGILFIAAIIVMWIQKGPQNAPKMIQIMIGLVLILNAGTLISWLVPGAFVWIP